MWVLDRIRQTIESWTDDDLEMKVMLTILPNDIAAQFFQFASPKKHVTVKNESPYFDLQVDYRHSADGLNYFPTDQRITLPPGQELEITGKNITIVRLRAQSLPVEKAVITGGN